MTNNALGGFRLQRFSVLNWGTFDQKIWQLTPEQQNSLLTGNIGSGKSTLIDALTTLLVPTRKLAFNKAAGAIGKERSLESYFHGFYTSQQDDMGKARAVGLRQNTHYSVLLAEFHSSDLQQTVCLAQVIWLPPHEKKVRRLFITASEPLTIAEDFHGFGNKISLLKKHLRKYNHITLFDSFTPYQQSFSKLLGLGADGKALELFNQTISMKSVNSVTDFVRSNMLEQADVEGQLVELERNYNDLKRLHDAVVAARQKVELLTPIDAYGKQALTAYQEKQHFEDCRELTDAYMAQVATTLYQARIEKRQHALKRLDIQLNTMEQEKLTLNEKLSQLQESIRNNGGGRLQQLESDIRQLGQIRDDSRQLCLNYQKLAAELELTTTLTPANFIANLSAAKDKAEALQESLNTFDDELFQLKREQVEKEQKKSGLTEQLNILEKRKSNIHTKQLTIRAQLCQQLDIDESRLPFVGELIQVKHNASLWQGAIERVLHNFALSLLVPDDLYSQVCDFVEHTHLGSRLVYYRIQPLEDFYPSSLPSNSMLTKIDIKPDSEYYDWLHKELQQRFDYTCTDDMQQFRRSDKAITPKGQLKSGRIRHEKDDRHNILDKSRYVLGWSNKDKVNLLKAQRQQLEQEIANLAQSVAAAKMQKSRLEQLCRTAQNLAEFGTSFSYEKIDWSAYSSKIEALQAEKQTLEKASDLLIDLRKQYEDSNHSLQQLEQALRQSYTEQGQRQSEISADQQALSEQQALYNAVNESLRQRCFPTIDALYQQHIESGLLRINRLANLTSDLRTRLNSKVQHLEEKRRKRQNQMISAMGDFARAFPNDVTEVDKSPESLPEYQHMLKQLSEEDLPRHEVRFKEMLNRDTIRAMALFRSYLDKQEEAIESRIQLINQALHELDYQAGTYIEINSLPSPDVDIRDFKHRLKQCIEFSSDDTLYSEEKFERVKDLIEQMRNEPKWTEKVVDVRYWHLFNVIERFREDDSEKECYSDSGGKSGGQKEKLAYSILAAAILLQYRLVDMSSNPNQQKRRFNLVVIDEAFARGSKDSTRFGLELFKKLGLQLLLVTPLQKLDVIEHYVQHVHFVDQKENRSLLLNMTIEEYRHRLDNHKARQQYQHLVEEEPETT